MRPAGEIERLLTGLRDHASASFDQRTLGAMFLALETSISESPVRSWRDTGRAVMCSRVVRLAAAAVLALAVLLVARHLIGREGGERPEDRGDITAQSPQNKDVPTPSATAQEQERARLAEELAAARKLFVDTDVKGLLQLLDTGLDPTKIAVAEHLAQIGDESALPALQKLAEQWTGPAEDNPFRKSIEQIRKASSRRGEAEVEGRTREQTPARLPAADANHITIAIHVCEKESGNPISNATIRAWAGKAWQVSASDEKGTFIYEVGESVPALILIAVRPEGYVWQSVDLQNLTERSLPRTIQFSLDRGTVIGGVVQDATGRPIAGATVQTYISQKQQFYQPRMNVRIEETTDDQGRWRSINAPSEIDRLWFNVRHPEFADGGFEMPRDLKLDDLRTERAIMVLNEGISVTGRVTDAAGKPIADAALLAGEDYVVRDWTTSDAAGYFEFKHLRPINQSFLLTVQARGFAPQRRELPSEKGLAPVEFVLQPAKLLIGRVVDSEGKPVEDAFVVTERWNRYRTVRWQDETDANGVFTWDYPPADAIEIRIDKTGFRQVLQDVVANDQEQIFVLAKPMTIRGAVTDSGTGEPVSRFKVTPGIQWNDGSNRAVWQSSEGWVRWFTDGRYSYTFSSDGKAYAVRIEADGYIPAESRFVDANEQGVTIDIALTKGRGPSSIVFDVNAAPVEGAEVFWEKIVWVENGQVRNKTNRVYTKTDKDGRFAFKPEDRKDPLLVLSDRGMGVALYDDLARDGFITLTPWARVQGDLRIGTRPAVKTRLQLVGQSRLPEGIHLDTDETLTDEQGWFVFEKVYPGEFRLYNQTYEVLPGQALELHLGGAGRTVRGELALPVPGDTPIWANLELVSVQAPVPLDKYPRPPEYERMTLSEVEAWLDRFGRSAEGKAYAAWLEETYPQTGRSFRVEMDERSAFHVDNVGPGVYALRGDIQPSSVHDSSRLNEVIGRLWHQFEILPPAHPSELDIPLDLGTLALLPAEVRPGDPAPDFDVPACGAGRIRLADYRGKVLLVTFCASGHADLTSTEAQNLKGIYDRFRGNPRYAQVGLLFAGNPVLTRKVVDEAGLDWPQGLLEGQGLVITAYNVRTVPWNVVIGPRGEILAMGSFGEALTQAVEDALRTAR